jgi:hypothetical protein
LARKKGAIWRALPCIRLIAPINSSDRLLAYLWDEMTLTLFAIGPHENLYRDLKR